MIILEDSNKSYPPVVAQYQILKYSIIMHEIIDCFEIDSNCLQIY